MTALAIDVIDLRAAIRELAGEDRAATVDVEVRRIDDGRQVSRRETKCASRGPERSREAHLQPEDLIATERDHVAPWRSAQRKLRRPATEASRWDKEDDAVDLPMNVTQKLIGAHLMTGHMNPGQEVALAIDQTL